MIWFITEFRLLQSLVTLCLKKLSSKLIENVVGFFGKERLKKKTKKLNKLTSYSIATNSVLFVLVSTLHRGKGVSFLNGIIKRRVSRKEKPYTGN